MVIGGIAVAAHAAIRATEDVDIVPDPEAANLNRLFHVLEELDARLLLNPDRSMDAGVRSALHRGRNLTLTTRLGDLDVVQRLPGVPSFPALEADAVGVTLSGVAFRVCS